MHSLWRDQTQLSIRVCFLMSDIHANLNVKIEPDLTIEQRLNLQTAKIAWSELLRFFAAGKAVCVDRSLDLIDVAASMPMSLT